MPTLYVLSGPEVGKTFSVRAGDTLGRAPDRIVTLRHPSVSRAHAHLEEQDGTWYLVDDGSRNGVLLGGGRVDRAPLHDAVELAVGEIRLRFRLDQPAPDGASYKTDPDPEPAEDEIFLGADEDEREPAPKPAQRAAAPQKPSPRKPAGADNDPARKVLQYHRAASEGGTDLAQLPPLQRTALIVVALAVAAGIAYLAFQGTFFVKSQGA